MDKVIEPLGAVRERLKAQQEEEEAERKATELAQKIIQKDEQEKQRDEQEKRRCRHPNHSTYFVNKQGRCRKMHKCPDHGAPECVVTAK